MKKNYRLAEMVTASKPAFEFGGVRFKQAETYHRLYTARLAVGLNIWIYNDLDTTGVLTAHIFTDYDEGTATNVALCRKVNRLARKAGLISANVEGRNTNVRVASKADERRFASFLQALKGKKIRRTLVASGCPSTCWS